MKRFFDILLSVLAIIALSPILLIVIIILKLTGEHYIFYKQERIGYNQKPFYLLKFATMLKDSPNMGTGDITTRNDPRVLPFGKFLRKTKINELPQLFNILFGDMSIIGPRPVTQKHFSFYSDKEKECIGKLRPGLSGIGSVVFRDEESIIANANMDYAEFYQKKIAPYKGALEKWYYQHNNLFVDFMIIVLTVIVVIVPGTNLPFRCFKSLPQKPSFLEN